MIAPPCVETSAAVDTRPINFSAFSNRSGNEATLIAVTHSQQAFTFLYSSPSSQQSIYTVSFSIFSYCYLVVSPDQAFCACLADLSKSKVCTHSFENFFFIMKCINTNQIDQVR